MNKIRAKKRLGQHFLRDHNIARKIVDSLGKSDLDVLEIGPGTGVLTQFLLENSDLNLHLIEVDIESVEYLREKYPGLKDKIYHQDFLKWNAAEMAEHFNIIGNFPYNISSQIFFRILEWRNRVPEVVCMVQKEVAERLSSPPGNKSYGILTVLLGAFYEIEYLFTVSEHVFIPPPKVKSAVIRLKRNKMEKLPCSEELFFRIVKAAFNQRRKMLRNSLSELQIEIPAGYAEKRPEQLSVPDFISLTGKVEM